MVSHCVRVVHKDTHSSVTFTAGQIAVNTGAQKHLYIIDREFVRYATPGRFVSFRGSS